MTDQVRQVTDPVRNTTRIGLVDGCSSALCLKMGYELQLQLDGYKRGAAIMPVPLTLDDYLAEHRTARRRAVRAGRMGYRFAEIDRRHYTDDIHRVNVSKAERQGRPMSAGYQERPRFGPEPVLCPRHHVYTYGVMDGVGPAHLVAYLWLYRSGELAMVSSILGHADYLADGIMYLLYVGMIERESLRGGTVFYNLWRSGTDGLRFYKERVGLAEGDVEWTL